MIQSRNANGVGPTQTLP